MVGSPSFFFPALARRISQAALVCLSTWDMFDFWQPCLYRCRGPRSILLCHQPVLLPPLFCEPGAWISAARCPVVMCQAQQAVTLPDGEGSPVLHREKLEDAAVDW
jgi:hypothetical protein